jgi:hypothetical protein
VWLAGSAVGSFLGPALVLPMLYVAYFFPPRLAWRLAAVEIATYASPLLYADPATHLMPARTLAYAVAYVGLTATVQFLKRRLVGAERRQREMAHPRSDGQARAPRPAVAPAVLVPPRRGRRTAHRGGTRPIFCGGYSSQKGSRTTFAGPADPSRAATVYRRPVTTWMRLVPRACAPPSRGSTTTR